MQSLTTDQYQTIIRTIREGRHGLRANPRIAAALTVEANLGIRIGDVLKLRLSDIIIDGGRYRLNIREEKTGKRRTFTVPAPVYEFLKTYSANHSIAPDETLFPITVRAVQKHLKSVCDLLGYSNISTHSFRKWYATDIYNNSGHDIVLVQTLLQHSSPTITRRYIGISEEKIESAIAQHVNIISV